MGFLKYMHKGQILNFAVTIRQPADCQIWIQIHGLESRTHER